MHNIVIYYCFKSSFLPLTIFTKCFISSSKCDINNTLTLSAAYWVQWCPGCRTSPFLAGGWHEKNVAWFSLFVGQLLKSRMKLGCRQQQELHHLIPSSNTHIWKKRLGRLLHLFVVGFDLLLDLSFLVELRVALNSFCSPDSQWPLALLPQFPEGWAIRHVPRCQLDRLLGKNFRIGN